MKFTVDTTIFMTDSKFITLLHNACWYMMQCNCMEGLKFEHSISVLMQVTTPQFLPIMLFTPSVVTQQSSFRFKRRLLRVSHSFWKISSPVVVPFKLWSPPNSSVISNSALIPWTNISTKQWHWYQCFHQQPTKIICFLNMPMRSHQCHQFT
jgi:hypothetical protein